MITKIFNILIFTLVLIFSLQSWTKADNISEFEIEGMSVGDSLLDFFTKEEIDNMYIVTYPKSKKYIKLGMNKSSKLEDYEHVTFHVKENDKKYIIHTINGVIFFENRLSDCLNEKENVVNDLSSVITDIKSFDYEYKYKGEDEGSIAYVSDFEFKDKSSIRVWCVDWTEFVENSKSFADSLSISISPNYFFDWLNTEAYE
tara:strand:+ start:266 stop:868 length:603 start_codon:yes stop_codon:yes gene_type:complete